MKTIGIMQTLKESYPLRGLLASLVAPGSVLGRLMSSPQRASFLACFGMFIGFWFKACSLRRLSRVSCFERYKGLPPKDHRESIIA